MSERHTRRDFLRASTAGLAATLAGPGAAFGQRAASGQRPPNFIVMMADDLGARELGCYSHPEHRTPHLDRLARTGVQFATCYSTPICHPTRFMIMTGQYAHHNGIYNFGSRRGGPAPGDPAENIASHMTFAQVLKQKGYATAHAGKWQLSGQVPTLVHEAGFDEYCMWAYRHNLPKGVEHTGGWEGKGKKKTSRYWHPSIMKNGQYVPTQAQDYGPDIFADFVIDFVKRHRDRPFFVYYPMALTHSPYYTTPDTTQSPDDHFKHLRTNWQANVEYTDKIVGRIAKCLDALGLRDHTILFFTGDNGTGGNGKGQPTELGARVPGIFNCPGTVKARGLTGELADLSDVLPTLAGFAGTPLPEGRPIDGKDLAPFLRGERASGPREWAFSYIADRRVLRDRRWLLEDNSPRHPGRFYDCGSSRDGTGYRDVTDSTDADVVAARKRFEEILADKPAPPIAYDGPAAQLKSKAGKGRRGRGQEMGSGGPWSAAYLRQPEKWSAGFNSPVVKAAAKGLRVEVREGQKRGVAMVPKLFTFPEGATAVRLCIAETSPGVRWLFKLVGDCDGSGRVRLAQTIESKATGWIERPLDAKILGRPDGSWGVKLGLTGPAGSYVVVEDLEFVVK